MTLRRFAELEIAFGLGMNFAGWLILFVRPWLDRRRAARAVAKRLSDTPG